MLIELERQLERRRGGLGEVPESKGGTGSYSIISWLASAASRLTSVTSSNAASHIKPSIPLSLRTSPRRWPTNTTSIDGTRCRVS